MIGYGQLPKQRGTHKTSAAICYGELYHNIWFDWAQLLSQVGPSGKMNRRPAENRAIYLCLESKNFDSDE